MIYLTYLMLSFLGSLAALFLFGFILFLLEQRAEDDF